MDIYPVSPTAARAPKKTCIQPLASWPDLDGDEAGLPRQIQRRLSAIRVGRSESCCGGDPELRIARGGHGFEGSTPTEVGSKVFGCVAMERRIHSLRRPW
jgi:hypothetical protein